MTGFQWSDGGRKASGRKGQAGDCVVRALTIANREDYGVVYDELFFLAKEMQDKKPSPREGVKPKVYKKWLADRGWDWTPTMLLGQGCRVHLRSDELPSGVLILRLSGHLCAFIDGTIWDTFDPSRGGTRCVYGFWSLPPKVQAIPVPEQVVP